jgi:hypothetical protein
MAVRILDLLDAHPEGLTRNDLRRILGRSRSTVGTGSLMVLALKELCATGEAASLREMRPQLETSGRASMREVPVYRSVIEHDQPREEGGDPCPS